jgi:hypothetical protein
MLIGYTEKSRTSVQKNEVNTIGIMVPLVAFNTVIDTDVGIIRLICDKYLDPKVFNVDLLHSLSVKGLVGMLYDREKPNPLTVFSSLDDTELDELYDDFMKNHYQDILNLSLPTEIFNQIGIWQSYGGIRTTILCRSNEEVEYLDKFTALQNYSKCLITNFSVKGFQQFFFKYIDDPYINAVSDNPIFKKSIYIAHYKFNIKKDDESKFNKEEAIGMSESIAKFVAMPANSLRTYDLYNRQKLYNTEAHHGKN